MKTNIIKTIGRSIKNWWVPLLIGIVLIITSIWTFMSPLESYFALAIVFSISFLVSGIMEIYFSIANRDAIPNWGWNLAFGILTTIVGVMLIANPAVTMVTLPLYIGFVVLFRSISAIGWALDVKDYGVSSWKGLLFTAILGIILSIMILWQPAVGGFTLVFWTGMAFLMGGIYSIYLAVQLRKLHKKVKDFQEEID
ncbi:MAG: HdeD family acid-resistance protein [Flavobacteriaceae bacterium]